MDARSLLRAKKAEAKIEHPYASYSASGVLRCSICAVPVKQWDAHLLTKQHRTSVAREKAIQAKTAAKRAAPEPSEQASSKRSRMTQEEVDDGQEQEQSGTTGLPAGFFDAGKTSTVNDDDDEAGDQSLEATMAVRPAPEPTGDAELDDFLASLENDDAPVLPSAIPVQNQQPTKSKGYQLSSSMAAPGIASYEAAPVRLPQPGDAAAEEEEQQPEETEEEKRERIAREEREEIMGRLEEEERAQEDADSRVSALKARMEALKKKRESRPAKTKTKATTNGA